jgi:hypothetical protein
MVHCTTQVAELEHLARAAAVMRAHVQRHCAAAAAAAAAHLQQIVGSGDKI